MASSALLTPTRDVRVAAETNLCQGINHSNGRPCRNIVSAARVMKYCHQHQAQAQQLSRNDQCRVNHDSMTARSSGDYAPIVRPESPTLKIPGAYPDLLPEGAVSARSHGRPQLAYTTSDPDRLAKANYRNDSSINHLTEAASHLQVSSVPPRIQKATSNRDAGVQLKSTVEPSRHNHKNRFSMTKFLVGLGCLPSSMRRLQDHERPQHKLDQEEKLAISPITYTEEKKELKRIPRKPVDLRSKEQIERENKIRKDRVEIERLISSETVPSVRTGRPDRPGESHHGIASSKMPLTTTTTATPADMVGKVRSDLRPLQSPMTIRRHMTKLQQDAYYLERYANIVDYPHKSTKGMARMQEVIRSIVNAALIASFSEHDVYHQEFVYVFRLDGDYHNTPRISLKIGRSKDVNARLKQWFHQCRYKVDKLEEFQTRHAVLLERMMHLEFEEDRVLKQCRCGHTHREWFDIRRGDARGRIRRALMKWASFADEIQALRIAGQARA